MSKDITTQYTKEQNKKNGRKGYGAWKREKETVITPSEYGRFITRGGKRSGRK